MTKDYRDIDRFGKDKKLIFYSKELGLRLFRQFDTAWHCDAFSFEVDDNLYNRRTIILILIKRDIIEARVMGRYNVSIVRGYDINSVWFQSKVLASIQERANYLHIYPDLTEHVHVSLY